MNKKDPNYIASVEKAIKQKSGEEAIKNPMSGWDEEKEKVYLEQMKQLYDKSTKNKEWQDKVDVNGIKVTKKLLNKEPLHTCPVCGSFPKKAMDDVCLLKFECCSKCYIQYVEGREERWLTGWRPDENKQTKT